MQFFTLSNILMFVLLIVVLSLLLLPSPLVYTLSLVVFVVGSIAYSSYYSLLSGLMGLLILLVYVGAMMIMISYICAISPNVKYSFSFSSFFFSSITFVLFLVILLVPSFSSSEFLGLSPSPSLLFTDMGF